VVLLLSVADRDLPRVRATAWATSIRPRSPRYLSSWGFWITFIFVVAEVCLANVLVADIVYLLIWSLYPEYSVLADQLPTPFMTMGGGGNTIALKAVVGNHNMNSGGTIGATTKHADAAVGSRRWRSSRR
jgi:hypothetical protein